MTNNEYDHVQTLLARREELANGDPRRGALRDQAVIESLPLARHIAQRFRGRGENLEDLLQVASVGLIHAADRFEPSRGADFLSFAVPTVMGEVRRHFRDRTAMMRVPRRARELSLQITDAEGRLSQQLRRSPTDTELAAEIGVEANRIDDARQVASATAPASLDRPTNGEEDGRPTVERLGHEDAGYGHVDDAASLKPALARLHPRERRILGLRFFEDLSQRAIADRTGLSQMHVSRLLRQSLDDLRQELTPA